MIFWVFEAFEAFHMSFKSSYSSNKASSTQKHITKIVFETSSPVVHRRSKFTVQKRNTSDKQNFVKPFNNKLTQEKLNHLSNKFCYFWVKHDAAKSRENMLLPSSCILFNNNRVFRGHRQKCSFKTLGDTQMSACEMALWQLFKSDTQKIQHGDRWRADESVSSRSIFPFKILQ